MSISNLPHPAVSIVIPVYNEENNIMILFERVVKVLREKNLSWEVIFINDGSTDNSLSILKTLAEKDNNVKYLNLSRNFGHQAALTAGLDYVSGDAVITMDCDLQDPPELIGNMLDEWKNGFEVVYARRINYRNDNLFKRYASMLHYSLLDKYTDVHIPKNVGDFRLIDKKVLDEVKKLKENSRYLRGMIAWLGFKHTFVDYERPDRTRGKSGYSISKLIKLGMDSILSYSLLPLKLGLIIGVFSILLGILILIYMIGDIMINHVYYHLYKFLVDIIFIFMGFLFILIWILGEYIGRIFRTSKGRPLYILTEKGNL